MDDTPASILVVSNREDEAELVGHLAGLGVIDTVDGSDHALKEFTIQRSEVVVVAASLDAGDARALIAAIRGSAAAGTVHVILVGDAQGPIRNALDAADFGADRFIARPVSGKALRFAVTHGIAAARRGRAAEHPARITGTHRAVMVGDGSRPVRAPTTPPMTSRLEAALDAEIEDVVREEVVRRTSAGFAVPVEAILAAGGALEDVHDVPTRPVSVPDLTLRPRTTPPPIPPPRDTAPIPAHGRPTFEQPAMVDLSAEPSDPREADPIDRPHDESGSHELPPGMMVETDGSFDSDMGELPLPEPDDVERDDDWAPPIPVREPTLIINEGSSAPAPVNLDVTERRSDGWVSTSSVSPMADDGGTDSGGRAPPPPPDDADDDELEDHRDADLGDLSVNRPIPAAPAPPPPSGGDFARELRRKMSAMAQRLFRQGDGAAPPPVDVRPPHDYRTEIDLAAIEASDRPSRPEVYDLNVDATFAGDDHGLPTGAGGIHDEERRPQGHVTGTTARTAESGEVTRGNTDAAALMARMFVNEFTGRVMFQRAGAEKQIYFDGGRPVFASSNLPEDRMGELLYREGKITAEQFARSREHVLEQGRRMGEILVDRGFLKRRELLPAVRRHVEDIIYSLFAWDSGEYRIVPGDGASSERIRLSRHPAAMVLEGIRRKLDLATLERLLGPPTTVVEIADRDKGATVVSVADLSPDERTALAAMDGSADLGHIARATGAGLVGIYQLAFAMTLLGVATVRRRGGEEDDAPALVGEIDLAIDRERVRARHRLVAEADYFALLGVRRTATAFEIRRAYEASRRDFDADSFPPELRAELTVELAEIGSVLDEAFRVLRDDRLRREYLSHLAE